MKESESSRVRSIEESASASGIHTKTPGFTELGMSGFIKMLKVIGKFHWRAECTDVQTGTWIRANDSDLSTDDSDCDHSR